MITWDCNYGSFGISLSFTLERINPGWQWNQRLAVRESQHSTSSVTRKPVIPVLRCHSSIALLKVTKWMSPVVSLWVPTSSSAECTEWWERRWLWHSGSFCPSQGWFCSNTHLVVFTLHHWPEWLQQSCGAIYPAHTGLSQHSSVWNRQYCGSFLSAAKGGSRGWTTTGPWL